MSFKCSLNVFENASQIQFNTLKFKRNKKKSKNTENIKPSKWTTSNKCDVGEALQFVICLMKCISTQFKTERNIFEWHSRRNKGNTVKCRRNSECIYEMQETKRKHSINKHVKNWGGTYYTHIHALSVCVSMCAGCFV